MFDRKEYIERGAAYEIIETEGKRIGMTVCNRLNCKELLLRVPAADVVEVVRCRECRKRGRDECPCHVKGEPADEELLKDLDDDYCSYGERKDGADNA